MLKLNKNLSLLRMEFYVTVDSQNCTRYKRLAGILSITLPYTIELQGQWCVALCQYGLNNGVFHPEGELHNQAYLTTRIVSPQILGDQTHRILAVIPLDFVSEILDMVYYFREIQHPLYVQVD